MLYLIFTTDVWHTNESKDLIGIATTKLKVVSLINKHARSKSNPILTAEEKEFLNLVNQTQGYKDYDGDNEFEYLIETVAKNELF